jgi:hypothetical protein
VHTDIEAPYKLDIQGLGQLETGRGVAYSAELVHPELGVVGRIANEGCGGPTMFHTYDPGSSPGATWSSSSRSATLPVSQWNPASPEWRRCSRT